MTTIANMKQINDKSANNLITCILKLEASPRCLATEELPRMEKIGQWAWPFVFGTVAGMILLSFVFGFMSSGGATKLADQAKVEGVLSVTTPRCVAAAQAAPTAMAEMMALASNKQREALTAAGWATYPEGASASLVRAIDEACLKALK